MREIDINKYWIGYLYGCLILLNIFSAGVIITIGYNLNLLFFTWTYFLSLLPIFLIKCLIDKQKKRILNERKENKRNNL